MPNAGPTVQTVALVQVISESTFGTDETGSLGSFTAVPIQEGTGSFEVVQEMHDPMQLVQNHHAYREEILGRKRWTMSFTTPLAPTGTGAGDTVAAVQGALGLLLKAVMGGEDLGTGSQCNGNWSGPTTGDVDAGGGFEQGTAIGWVNSSSVLEARPLKTKSTATLTTKLAFSATPADTDVIYSSATYYPTSDPAESLQFVVRGLESNDDWVLMGGQLESVALNLDFEGIPTVQFSFKGCDWLYGSSAAGSGSLSDITPVTYSNFDPIAGFAGRLMVQTNGTTTFSGSTVDASAVSFAPQIAFQPIPSPSGINGVARYRLSRNQGPSCTGGFSTYFEDLTHFTNRDNKTDLIVLYQIGTTAGETILLEASTCQWTNVQRTGEGNIAGVTVEWKARNDGDITSAAGDLELAPYRIHFL